MDGNCNESQYDDDNDDDDEDSDEDNDEDDICLILCQCANFSCQTFFLPMTRFAPMATCLRLWEIKNSNFFFQKICFCFFKKFYVTPKSCH